MKKILYLVLAILSIVYIGFLTVDVMIDNTAWNPDLGWFEGVFDFIVRFGGIALIFAYALTFLQGRMGVVCFIFFCVFVLIYVIILFIPDSIYDIFAGNKEIVSEAIKSFMNFKL